MEIVVRAVLLFGFLWLITRVVGRSTLGELSTFQLLLFVTMGDLVQQSITQQDYCSPPACWRSAYSRCSPFCCPG